MPCCIQHPASTRCAGLYDLPVSLSTSDTHCNMYPITLTYRLIPCKIKLTCKLISLAVIAAIPATLISGINSDLPGQVIAQVNQNVYDTATHSTILLPQGSKL
ncbi:hypothetical protein CU276_20965, partial [Yersinia kristensenii]